MHSFVEPTAHVPPSGTLGLNTLEHTFVWSVRSGLLQSLFCEAV